jgi:hypothetical protein
MGGEVRHEPIRTDADLQPEEAGADADVTHRDDDSGVARGNRRAPGRSDRGNGRLTARRDGKPDDACDGRDEPGGALRPRRHEEQPGGDAHRRDR